MMRKRTRMRSANPELPPLPYHHDRSTASASTPLLQYAKNTWSSFHDHEEEPDIPAIVIGTIMGIIGFIMLCCICSALCGSSRRKAKKQQAMSHHRRHASNTPPPDPSADGEQIELPAYSYLGDV